MLITYKGNDEVLVTTRKREAAFLIEFFGPVMGREVTEYDRIEYLNEDGIEISSRLTIA